MTELIPGKRYRWTVEGTADNAGFLDISDDWYLNCDQVDHGTLELLPDPLPTTPGSVLMDSGGDAWQLTKGGWRNAWGGHDISTEHLQKEYSGWTVLFDAGADRA